MRVSQLIHCMDRNDEIIIDDFDKLIENMTLYKGVVKGIKKDDPINKMHVVSICADDDKVLVLAETAKWKGGKS